ncbi:nicotinate-nucleotide adenylyltransferase [Legionella oakridgensis]|uniref:Probable nicotinate-nucleotide adenylyltransferase n=2 Tax=Legionella oakridgensis TaxID=29423 RepID=W0BFH1_9GAMM|nr:nicotinate-nucleotide adenylyltransferase [Legionella oakridgensis]AHE67189.1 nicotinate nicotinamide nucleotide adenylyltransferase [Legionella oakridgensis ATCC 33761 = DSM 21215]ETO93155.1 nicotinate-nucleotide adenylyltransferase [Legionella oakridgensis RV-2-2007]KTD38010.1 nicotinate-nucleotide adenylyltransferase [Legionella oakridgensis]STY20268.1 nicotinate-nucleotide adenylyltransferase [Legionella longbeachae]
MRHLIIYGGSFDPPHNGHLNTAIAVQNEFHFERFVFLPCKTPVLKEATQASCEQRISMLQLALLPYREFHIDTREIERDAPSYMVNTLESFREEIGEKIPITLLMGMDAFLRLPEWYQWQRLLALSHILVIQRPQINPPAMPQSLEALLSLKKTTEKSNLLTESHGKIFCYDAGQYDISSSWLRKQIKSRTDVRNYLPSAVYQYIKEQALYQ